MPNTTIMFDQECTLCPRLSKHLKQVRKDFPDYHGLPVAPFGATKPKFLIVGLAPGLHGANATGRPFTGDFAGIILYETLFKFGFSNQPEATNRGDGLKLKNCRITNAVKCLPPENKPTGSEIKTCNTYLKNEITSLRPKVILALGKIAHDSVLRAMDFKLSECKFTHNACHSLTPKIQLVDSYHCSRYNTNTRRLTESMFHDVFKQINKLIKE